MRINAHNGKVETAPRSLIEAAVVIAALCGSAFIALFARFSASSAPLAWIAAAPLFAAICRYHPARAAAAGFVWGACFAGMLASLYLESAGCAVMRVGLTAGFLAAYTGGAALLRRRVGFAPLPLAVLWALLEIVLSTTATAAPGGVLSAGAGWMASHGSAAQFLGYALVACGLAYVNARLVRLLDAAAARLTTTTGRHAQVSSSFLAIVSAPAPAFARAQHHLRMLLPRGPPPVCAGV